jgi:hypothetical protein
MTIGHRTSIPEATARATRATKEGITTDSSSHPLTTESLVQALIGEEREIEIQALHQKIKKKRELRYLRHVKSEKKKMLQIPQATSDLAALKSKLEYLTSDQSSSSPSLWFRHSRTSGGGS